MSSTVGGNVQYRGRECPLEVKRHRMKEKPQKAAIVYGLKLQVFNRKA